MPPGISPWEIAEGIRVEMEHTNDPRVAREIAADHLTEDPRYYSKLRQVHLDGPLVDRANTGIDHTIRRFIAMPMWAQLASVTGIAVGVAILIDALSD